MNQMNYLRSNTFREKWGRETLQENTPCLDPLLWEIAVFCLRTTFFDSFNVLFSFLAEKDAERSRNYFKKNLESKCAVLINKYKYNSSGY